MNKELTPLQALKDLQEVEGWNNKEFHKRLTVIKKALKEYEGAKAHIESLNKERIENSIKLKALEIIKEKEVDIHDLLISKTVEQYNGYTHWLGFKGNLTQEEFDTVKEVLL